MTTAKTLPQRRLAQGAKLRVTLATLSEVPKLGSMDVIKVTRATSAIVRKAGSAGGYFPLIKE
ncbi:hypothetical protein [Mesorhizobium ventifaucium]|uniref:hypothetical protein n=1 Tax=Mesorhizobium ventifaucium TaxID=666020 RepID=UPI0020A7C5E3|nr:hypothetical protein [Mesorhizobium ventifaucium]